MNEQVKEPLDLTSAIIEYENGRLNDDQTLELFQHLVDTGLAWKLQGTYGRTAAALIKAGLVAAPEHWDRVKGWFNAYRPEEPSTAQKEVE